jgi:hypothetical protein
VLTTKEIKQRYFRKVYKNADVVLCACGCKKKIKNKDKYGRDKFFISGHNGRKYTHPNQYKREWNKRNKKYRYDLKKSLYRRNKVKLLLLKGGKCSKCFLAYDKTNACVFHFHHINPKLKKFNLSFSNYAWKRILKEAKKCVVLCANCHEMEHSAKF